MKILVDANVVFDVVERRQPHYAASLQVMQLARHNEVAAALASHTVANMLYLYGKEVVPVLRNRLLDYVEVVAGDAFLVKTSSDWGFTDLEDALQAAAALAWKSSFIVTRNTRDFRRSPVPALTPADFLKRFGAG